MFRNNRNQCSADSGIRVQLKRNLHALLCSYFILEYNRRKDWIGLGIFVLLASYTHYFACISVGVLLIGLGFIFVLHKDMSKIKRWWITIAISLTLYTPWLLVLFNQLFEKGHLQKHTAWIPEINFKQVLGYYSFFTTPSFNDIIDIFICMLTSLVLFLIYYNYIKEFKNKYFDSKNVICVLGIFILCGEVIIGIVTSIIIRPVFAARYIFCAVGAFWLSVSVAFGIYLENKSKKKFIYPALFIIGSVNMFLQVIELLEIF